MINGRGRQFGQLLERYVQATRVVLLEVEITSPGNRHAVDIETDFDNRVSSAVGLRGVVIQLADALHLLGPFERLRIINDEVAAFVLLALAHDPT